MYCEKCGSKLDDGRRFCPNCGSAVTPDEVPVPQAAPQSDPQAAPQSDPQAAPQAYAQQPAAPVATAAPAAPSALSKLWADKKKRTLLIGGATVIVVILAVLIVLAVSPKTIVLDDYISVTFEGLDTRGSANLDVDWDGLLQKIYDKAGKKNQSEIYYDIIMYGGMDIDLSDYSDLSNGDEIYIMYQINEDAFKKFNIKFKLNNASITVEGLQEPVYLDLFEDLEITYEGCAPYTNVSVENTSDNDFINEYVYYDVYDGYNISDGDVFTVVAYYDEYTAEANGYIITTDEKSFTAENLPQPTEINVFDYVTVTFTGMEGNGYAQYTVDSDLDYISGLYFYFDTNSYLSEGDVITLTCDLDWSGDPLKYGYTLTCTEQTYTVPTLDHYLSTFGDLCEYNRGLLLDAAAAYTAPYFDSTVENSCVSYIDIYGLNYWTRSLSNAESVGNQKLISVAEGTFTSWWSDYYRIYFVYEIEVTGHADLNEGAPTTLYGYAYITEPIVYANGYLATDEFNFSYGSECYQSYDELYENVLAAGTDVTVFEIDP